MDDKIHAYVAQAALLRRSATNQVIISTVYLRQAYEEAIFHRSCIDRWREVLMDIELKAKRGALHSAGSTKAANSAKGPETYLEQARRHVREGRACVARQREIVARLPDTGELSEAAKRLLAEFEATLRDQTETLRRLEKEAGG